jgi:trimeric autotransporter adhesin
VSLPAALLQSAAPQTTPAAPAPQNPPATESLPSAPVAAGGTIKGSVKAGSVPLPGVSVTATNTLTGKKFTTTTDVIGSYEMTIPQNGRYVIRAELAAFALSTKEALLNATSHNQQADFAMVLASRAAAQDQASTRQYGGTSGAQSLALLGAASDLLQAGSGSANSGVALPSMASNADLSSDSVAVSGQTGTTNPFAGMGDFR